MGTNGSVGRREPIIDANVFLAHLLDDHPDQSARAHALMRRIEEGELRAGTTALAVFEVVFVLERRLRVPKRVVRDQLRPLLGLTGLRVPGRERFRRALDLHAELNVPFADAYHAVVALEVAGGEVVSFDRDFDRIPGVTRIEP